MILAFAHPCLVVPDLEKASRFYQQMFGFEVISNEGWQDNPDVDRAIGLENSSCRGVMMKGHNCFLELFQFDSPSSQTESEQHLHADSPGIRHLAFYVDDCKAEYQRLLDLGGIALGEPAGDDESGYVVYGRDPFGNIIELAEIPDPRESPLVLPGVSSLGNFDG